MLSTDTWCRSPAPILFYPRDEALRGNTDALWAQAREVARYIVRKDASIEAPN